MPTVWARSHNGHPRTARPEEDGTTKPSRKNSGVMIDERRTRHTLNRVGGPEQERVGDQTLFHDQVDATSKADD